MEENTTSNQLPPFVSRFIRNEEGKLIIDPECKILAEKHYWKDRPAYSKDDRRVMIGHYDENGNLIPFKNTR